MSVPADTVSETIGERLRRLRVAGGFSQRALSGPGISYAYISRIEAGARLPSVKALRMLARKLGVSAEYLETGSEIPEVEQRELRLADAELKLRVDLDVEGAALALEALLAEALLSGDATAAMRARVGLGLAAARCGDHARATELLEHAVEGGLVAPASRPDVYSTLGRSFAALGQPERAVALFERSLERLAAEAPDDDAAALCFTSYLSFALVDLGDDARAQTVLRTSVGRSDRPSSPYARVRLYRSLGRRSGDAGRPLAALEYFRRAIALLEATEDSLHLARAHLSCAWVLISAGSLEDAARKLEQAERLFGPDPQPVDLVAVRRHQAALALRAGDFDDAASRAREAVELAGDAVPSERGNAWLELAEARAAQADSAEAERAFTEAARLLDEHGTPRERAACYRAWGRLLHAIGREDEALDLLERAADFAAEIRAHGAPVDR